jgi:hypothetical protein
VPRSSCLRDPKSRGTRCPTLNEARGSRGTRCPSHIQSSQGSHGPVPMLLLPVLASSHIAIFVVTRSPLAGLPPGNAKPQLGMGRVGGRRTSAMLGNRANPRATHGHTWPPATGGRCRAGARRSQGGEATVYGHAWRPPRAAAVTARAVVLLRRTENGMVTASSVRWPQHMASWAPNMGDI